MAEILISFAVDQLKSKAISLASEGISLIWGFKGELDGLTESLTVIQKVLHDAEKKQVIEESVKHWLEKLQAVAYDADDVLDKYAYEILRQKVEIKNQLQRKVLNFFSLHNPLAFRLFMALEIKMINGSLSGIQSQIAGLKLIVSTEDGTRPLSQDRETDAYLGSSEVVIGREEDLSRVMDLLTSSIDKHVLSVVPIVGMPGLGKTTLAKMVLKEVETKKLFDERLWVCVSENFRDEIILGGMLQTLDGTMGGITEINALLTHLKNKLGNKKFLLVLDDVWNDEPRKWDSLKRRLLSINENCGNAIIVTTRSKTVASIMETSQGCNHEIFGLGDAECWDIMKQQVSGATRTPVTSDLEIIGMEIAKKCRGVPLVATALSGILASNLKREEWLSIANNDVWDSTVKDDEHTLNVLKLSFDYLSSPSLKRCFAYCSIFPKDFDIEKEQLIQLWMAQGLLNLSEEEKKKKVTMEDKGDEYFRDLLAHSLFQDVQWDDYENIIGCKMHDLMHDLASLVSKSETLTLEATGSIEGDGSRIRHLNLLSYHKEVEPVFSKIDAKKLRALFSKVDVLNEPWSFECMQCSFECIHKKKWSFKGLRTLKLDGSGSEELPASIGKMKHLKYLDISRANIETLPQSFTKLYHLETLRFSDCSSLEKFPEEMGNLVGLRHLYFRGVGQVPAEVGSLTCLQSLHIEKSTPLTRDSWSLNNLVKLRLKNFSGWEQLPTLGHLPGLEIIEMEGIGGVRCIGNEFYASSEDTTAMPFRALKRLYLRNMSLEEWTVPATISGDIAIFPSLEVLFIAYCRQLKSIPSIYHLSSKLVKLVIRGCGKLRDLCGEFHASTPLKTLKIEGCFELRSISIGLQHCKALEVLEITHCLFLRSIDFSTDMWQSIRRVKIVNCSNLRGHLPLSRLLSHASLEELQIVLCHCNFVIDDDDLRSRPPPQFSSPSSHLQRLVIARCDQLTSLPDCSRGLTSLVELDISWCQRLTSFPAEGVDFFRNLTRLKRLKIGGFSEESEAFTAGIVNSMMHHLSESLQELVICGNQLLHQHQLEHLTSLKKLTILFFEGEEALPDWLANLSSLQELWIEHSDDIKYLPSSTAMKRLSKLRTLVISSCPKLQHNCRKLEGTEWPKISHIRDTRI